MSDLEEKELGLGEMPEEIHLEMEPEGEPGQEEPEAGEGLEPEETPPAEGSEDDGDEKYRKLQAAKDREVAQAQAEAAKYKQALEPVSDKLRETEDGRLVLDLSGNDDPEDTLGEGEELTLTNEDFVDDPLGAMNKLLDAREQRQQKASAAQRQRQQQIERAKENARKRVDSWGNAVKDYPDAKDKEGDLFKKAAEFMESTVVRDENGNILNGGLKSHPNGDYLAVQTVAAQLGIAKANTEPPPAKDDSFIIDGPGSPARKPSSESMTDAEFANLSREEQENLMKEASLSGG